MKLEEMLLIKEINKDGKETIYLSSLPDYLKQVYEKSHNSVLDMADAAAKLYGTKTDPYAWAEFLNLDTASSARFCVSESQLQGFLLGIFHQDGDRKLPYVFDEGKCSRECFGVLQSYGIGTDGHTLFNTLHYEPVGHLFRQGETIHNFNGNDYRILSVLSPDNLLLMADLDGQLVAGIGVQMYERYPKEPGKFAAEPVLAVEWQHGVYLGRDITKIDCDILKQDYGKTEKATAGRESIQEDFNKHRNIADNKKLSEKVRSAARESLWERYSTESREEFGEMLEKGRYDKMVPDKKKKRPGRSR